MPVSPNPATSSAASPADPAPDAAGRRLRILILTKVFPNALQPHHAAFNRQQFACLGRKADLELVVPVQWFPGAAATGQRTEAGRLAALPDFEWMDGLFVRHPRVLHVPRIDYALASHLYVRSLRPVIRKLRGKVDVILGSFLYPDGVAAIALGKELGIPAVVYALGSDVNVVPDLWGVTRVLKRALPQAARVVAVSQDLAERAIALGAPAGRTVVVQNGVDKTLFFPRDAAGARQRLVQPASGRWVLFVGRLEPAKGIEALLTAFARLGASQPDTRLVLVGDGSLRARCEEAAQKLPGRILVAGARPLSEVADWVAACDVLVLPSWNEGTPNVVLEALASGRPVVATRVGGIPASLPEPAGGRLVPPKDPEALYLALDETLRTTYDPASIAALGPVSWGESADRLLEVLRQAVLDRPS